MTCKECINHGACSLSGAPKFANVQNAEILCRLFKSVTEWAKVIRCEQCAFCSMNNGFPDPPPWCMNPSPLVHYMDLPAGFFCPYGKKVGSEDE